MYLGILCDVWSWKASEDVKTLNILNSKYREVFIELYIYRKH